MVMKKIFFLPVFLVSAIYAQVEERDTLFPRAGEVDTLFAVVPTPVFSIGISGGVTLINPVVINNQIEFNNFTFDNNETPIRSPAQWTLWLAFRPKNLPTYLSLRGEMITASRTFAYEGIVTDNSGATTGTFNGKATTRYSVYPVSINSGGFIPKTLIKFEVGFVYAFAKFTDETNLGSYSTSENSYEGEGYGFRAMVQQVMPILPSVGLTVEFGYRYLHLDEFRDSRGRLLNTIEANYNGVSMLLGISYGL